jgi:hypothetical protein
MFRCPVSASEAPTLKWSECRLNGSENSQRLVFEDVRAREPVSSDGGEDTLPVCGKRRQFEHCAELSNLFDALQCFRQLERRLPAD